MLQLFDDENDDEGCDGGGCIREGTKTVGNKVSS